ncbi:MAG: histidine triad nucleotide-binding protein [Candidatus Zixiibacteriota bacterium]|nr:MAG: histidine triad nucleotide-binding protein [candidate division Zixibacteria bacterium]HDL03376.1 HIT family protein [candidate division Zixibacteria bacterium]
MNCVFCQIVKGEKPARIYCENDKIIVFADILPRASIHLLICPRQHFTTLLELPDDLVVEMMETARKIARDLRLESNFRLVLNNGAAAGQIIEHIHFHFMSNEEGVKIRYKEDKI